MIPGFGDLPAWTLAWISGVMLLSGFVHGVIGFGFPIVATPLLTLVFDLKAAVLVSVVPTLFLTVINAFRGGRLRESVGRFWYLPLCLAVGSYAGTRLLIVAPSEPFLAVLALVLLVYLNLERLGGAKIEIVRAHPAPFAVAFGFAAGVFEATVNVAGPALLVFFMLAGIRRARSSRRSTSASSSARARRSPPGPWRAASPSRRGFRPRGRSPRARRSLSAGGCTTARASRPTAAGCAGSCGRWRRCSRRSSRAPCGRDTRERRPKKKKKKKMSATVPQAWAPRLGRIMQVRSDEVRALLWSFGCLAVNALTLALQLLVTGRLLSRLGVTVMLAALPAVSIAGFLVLGLATVLGVLGSVAGGECDPKRRATLFTMAANADNVRRRT